MGLTMKTTKPTPVGIYHFEFTTPPVPAHLRREVFKLFGYPDGNVNRLEAYPGEAAEFGLGSGSLVPVKWPEPYGLLEADRRMRGYQRCENVEVTVYSDGSRRVTRVT